MLYNVVLVSAISSVQLLRHVWPFATPWTAAHSLPCPSPAPRTCSNSCPKSQWCPSNHLILCRPFFLLSSIFPSIRVFSNESVLRIRWPKYWSFSFSISDVCLSIRTAVEPWALKGGDRPWALLWRSLNYRCHQEPAHPSPCKGSVFLTSARLQAQASQHTWTATVREPQAG